MLLNILKDKRILYIRFFSDENIIIHEIAHSLIYDLGHTRNFYNLYFRLLKQHSINKINNK